MKRIIEFNVSNEEVSNEQISSMLSDLGYRTSRDVEGLQEFNNSIGKIEVKVKIEIVTE